MCKYIILLLFFLPTSLSGQDGAIPFKHISTREGLSQGQVNALLKTSDGFLWAATQDGLNRYDGYQFRSFYHVAGDTNSLCNNFIWTLFEDSKGYLWAGALDGSICRYDRTTETFRTFSPSHLPNERAAENSVRTICEFPEGTLNIGGEKGLWQFDMQKERFIPRKSNKSLTGVSSLYLLGKNSLLVGTAEGLFTLNMVSGELEALLLGETALKGVTAFAAVNEEIWAGGLSGIFRLKALPQTDSVVVSGHLSLKMPAENNRLANAVTSLLLDEFGQLWAGSLEGLHRLDIRNPGAGFLHFNHHASQPQSLSDDQINCLITAEPGLLWAGARQGINQWENGPPVFQTISRATAKGLCSDVALGMAQDEQGALWIGTKEGLARMDGPGAPESTRCLSPAQTPGMGAPYVINVKYQGGEIWATFWRGGAGRLRDDRQGFDSIPGLNELTNGAGIHDLLIGRDGAVWLATPNRGVVRWNPESGQLTAYPPKPGDPDAISSAYIFQLLEDKQGNIWVGTATGGLCRMNPGAGTFRCFLNEADNDFSLSNNMVLSTFEDSRGRLWVCTANGLNMMESEGRFRRFGKEDGLPNEVVYGLLEDGEGALWASTNGGLSRIRYEDGVFTTNNYNKSHGLQGNEFNQYSFLKLAGGGLCFGGPGGLTCFDPQTARPSPYVPQIALTQLQLFNRPVRIGAGILQKAINETAAITLRHNQNYIGMEFAALGFAQPDNNRYVYQLEGLEKEWTPAGVRRFASYPNLSPGKYTFRVKAANPDGVWGEKNRSLQITILKPWWATWWAFALYLTTAIAVIAAVIRQREASVRRIEQAKAGERERFRKRIARDFHDEAGNRITKLVLLAEMARRRSFDPALIGQFEENIQALRAGMRDFIWVLDPDKDTLYDTLLRLRDFANGLFEHSPIRFRMEGLEEDLRNIPLAGNERRHVVLIFKEAMNNCVKYSEAREAVFSVNQEELVFSDDGIGFNPAAVSGNGIRYMKERAEKIGAQLGISATPREGVRISLRLKTTHTGN